MRVGNYCNISILPGSTKVGPPTSRLPTQLPGVRSTLICLVQEEREVRKRGQDVGLVFSLKASCTLNEAKVHSELPSSKFKVAVKVAVSVMDSMLPGYCVGE